MAARIHSQRRHLRRRGLEVVIVASRKQGRRQLHECTLEVLVDVGMAVLWRRMTARQWNTERWPRQRIVAR